MVQGMSWNVTAIHLVRKFPLLWNFEVHYSVQKILLLVSIMSQFSPVKTRKSNFSELHFNIPSGLFP